MKFKKTTLKNGLRILTVPMKGTETATVIVMVGVGSRFENEKESGLSHFVEHMFFKGTEKRPTAQSITEELDAIGGEFNAFTGKDRTAFYAKVDSKHVHKALDVVSDLFMNSKLDEAEIEKEKGPIIQEISMFEDEPRRSIGDEFEKLLYSGSSLGREIAGGKKTVAGFKRKDFVDYIKRHYFACETIVCVAGKINEKKVVGEIKNYFEKLQKGRTLKIDKISEKQKKPQVRIKFKKTDQTNIVLGNRAYKRGHKDRYALSLLSIILGGNMSSRLFNEVREKHGLAYFVHTGIETYEDAGYIATQAGIDHGKLEHFLKVVLAEYKRITDVKVSEEELQRAKDFIKGRGVMGFEASDEVAMFYINQEMQREKIMNLKEVFAKIDAVTAGDVLRVAKDVFKNEKLNCAIIGPHKNGKKILNMLRI